MKKVIFAVEDEESIRELYKYALTDFKVYAFETGKEMYEQLSSILPDLFILDIMLPDTSGSEIVDYLRQDVRYRNIPIIMCSAKGDEISKVKLLNLGADDYLSKPFGIMELIARINVQIRKSPRNSMSLSNVEINENEHNFIVNGERIAVTLKEYELLKYLMANANKTARREDLLKEVWGIDFEGETRTLDMHIKMLRDKLKESNLEIETLWGVGYMLRVKDEVEK
ncbi:MAG: response regulator transcription factor [Clostridia bacterium]